MYFLQFRLLGRRCRPPSWRVSEAWFLPVAQQTKNNDIAKAVAAVSTRRKGWKQVRRLNLGWISFKNYKHTPGDPVFYLLLSRSTRIYGIWGRTLHTVAAMCNLKASRSAACPRSPAFLRLVPARRYK